MIEIKNLTVAIEDKQILNGLNLTVKDGEVAAIMGPNGSGKSTLSYVIAGKEDYEVLDGEILLDGVNILEMSPDERAASGVFLAFQYPLEIPGVGTMTFLKATLNAQRRARGEGELSTPDFIRKVNGAAEKLEINKEMLKRALNVGFSGGEKKRMEILQMALLEPKFCVLDETDSGLDIDALRIVSGGVNALRAQGRSFLVITHYQRLLDYIVPDVVHVMSQGQIVKSGDQGPRQGARGFRLRRVPHGRGRLIMADITPLRTAAETALSKLFEATKMKYPTGVSIAREEAFRYFEAVGLPTRRVEAFKYTDLRSAFRDAAHPAEMPSSDTCQGGGRRGEGFCRDRGRAPHLRERPPDRRPVGSRPYPGRHHRDSAQRGAEPSGTRFWRN